MSDNSSAGNGIPEKRIKDRVTLPRKQVSGELHLEATGQRHNVRVYINDLSPSGVGLLIECPLEPGCAIVLHLKAPQDLSLIGEVVWCSQFIVHSPDNDEGRDSFAFKAGVKFSASTPELIQSLRKFLTSRFKQPGV